MVSAILPALSTALMIADTSSLSLVSTPMFISPAFILCVSPESRHDQGREPRTTRGSIVQNYVE
jgi:hypothetical protein